MKKYLRGAAAALAVLVFLAGCADPSKIQGTRGAFIPLGAAPLATTQAQEAVAVIYRLPDAQAEPMLVLVNDRVVGTLRPGGYTQTRICPGDQVGVLPAYSAAPRLRPEYQSINTAAGQTVFLRVAPADPAPGSGAWQVRAVDATAARKDLAGEWEGTYLVPRYVPSCGPVLAATPAGGGTSPVPPPKPPVILERVQLQADALFSFDGASLSDITPAGRRSLDELVLSIRSNNLQVERLNIVGHADRLGGADYNQRLSKARAVTVQQYLQQSGLRLPMTAEGRGSGEPVSRGCTGNRAAPALITCLQPDRRVVVDLIGQRQQSASR